MALNPGTECSECFRRGFSDFVSRAGLGIPEFDDLVSIVEKNLSEGLTPPLAGSESWALLRKLSVTSDDVFLREKQFFTEQMLNHYDAIRNHFKTARIPESMALQAATWCNLIDVAQGVPLPTTAKLLSTLSSPLTIDEREEFLYSLKGATTLLVLGDNAGETVMDRLFLDLTTFKGKRYYMTREFPVMNDALITDAQMARIHEVAELVSSGIDVPAVIPELLTGRAKEIFESADLILAKGQGNLEGLFGLNDPRVYHSFVVKCAVVSRATRVPIGSGVFARLIDNGGNNANL